MTNLSKEQLENQFKELPKSHKVVGIIISLLLVIAGIALFWRPVRGLVGLEYVITGLFIILGIFLIFKYFSIPKELRSGWTLVNGIILVILGLIYIFSNPAVMLFTFSFIFAVLTLSDGINLFIFSSEVKKQGGKTGLLIFSGILNVLLSIFFILTPFCMSWALAIIVGVYFIIAGITLFANCCTGSKA